MSGLILLMAMELEAKPVSATLLLQDGKRRIGYVANTNENGLMFQSTENPAETGEGIPFTTLRGVAFPEESDIMGQARYAYSRSNYEEAAKLFGEVAKEYEFLWGIPRVLLGNFACEARFFHLDCLRRLGRYEEMGAAMKTRTGTAMERAIAEVYLPVLKVFQLWSLYASQDWNALTERLRAYEKPLAGKQAELLSGTPFASNDPSELVQFYFMRGKMHQAKGQAGDALNDLYRAALLDYGADRQLAEQALESALALQAAEPDLAASVSRLLEIHALAVVYQDVYKAGQLPIRFQDYAKEPESLKKRRLEEQERRKEAAAVAGAATAVEPPATPE